MAAQIEPAELITAADIARRLAVTPQRVHQLVQQARFPRAVGRVGNSDVWRASDIERWRVQRAKEQWIADAVALVPRTGGLLQSMFRASLQNRLANAVGKDPATPGASVAEVVHAAMDSVKDSGVPRFDPALLGRAWPSWP
jgi:predicted DNA-binding transcriptional regulator AlpA